MAKFADKIQRHVSKGWRKEAEHLGQLWDVIRNFKTTAINKPFILTHWRKHLDIEAEPASFFYRVRGDRALLQIGDQIIGKDVASPYEQNATSERYTIISMRLLRDNFAVRSDDKCTVFRPIQRSQADFSNPYNYEVVPNAQIAAWNGTQWDWYDQPQEPSLRTDVWVSISVTGSATDRYTIPDRVPLTVRSTGWGISLGLLPGILLREGDVFVDRDLNWYRVDRPYYQIEAASVYQLHVTRLRT